MTDWRILVVEDDPDSQEVLNRILHHHGLTVDIADSGSYALSLLGKAEYAAAIIDLALPIMDGWELLMTIRDNPQTAGLPCFAVTAYHSAEVADQAMHAGFTAYFQKPVEPDSLMKALGHILA